MGKFKGLDEARKQSKEEKQRKEVEDWSKADLEKLADKGK
jgi:hypothetical protein